MKIKTLKAKIVIYVLISGLLALLIFTIASYIKQRDRILSTVREVALEIVDKTAAKVESGYYRYETLNIYIIHHQNLINLAKTQKSRDVESVKRNKYYEPVLGFFRKIIKSFPEISDVFIGLENTGNYVSVKYGVYDDITYDCRIRPWYVNARNADGFVPGTMVYDAGDSSTSLTCLIPLRDENKKLLGIVGLDTQLDITLDLIKSIHYGENGRGFLVMQDKQMLYFPGLDFKIGRYLKDIDEEIPNTRGFAELDTLIWRNNTGSYTVTMRGRKYYVFYSSLKLLNWKLGIVIPEDEILAPAREVLTSSIFYFLLGLLLMLAASYFIANPVIRPMEELAERFEELSSREGDLTRKLRVREDNEIGKVSAGFNVFIENLRKAISLTKEKTSMIAAAIGQLVVSSNEMSENADKIASQTNEIATAAKELSQSIGQITRNARNMEKAISQSEADIENSSSDVEKFIAGADNLVEGVHTISESLTGLGEFTEKIEGTITFIDDIADRVSLLALNASIEAATAGEHGKGFQVVANEVKNLSDKIFGQTTDIKNNLGQLAKIIGDVQNDLQNLSNLANEEIEHSQKARSGILSMEKAIKDSHGSIMEISSEAGQQASSTELISMSIDDIAERNRKFLSSIKDAIIGIETISKMIMELQEQFKRMKTE
jgi:methyl-accepting chemotaxis protein